MQIGYTEQQVGHMYFWKWAHMYDAFKKYHNMTIKQEIFAEPEKIVSIMDL